MPLMSHEVRWFFQGKMDDFQVLQNWMLSTKPFPDEGVVPPPKKMGRMGDKPDVYLLIPGSDDMGVKWREGQLQLKGRMARRGVQRFCGRFFGSVELWAKWSYKNDDVEAAFEHCFDGAPGKTWSTAAVRKTRIVRKIRLDSQRRNVEVSASDAFPDRGLNVELTDLQIDGDSYCSLGFEAFPDDTDMSEAFTDAVEACLNDLSGTSAELPENQSMAYPEFLRRRVARDIAALATAK